jgi:aminopeptidase N
VLKQLASLSNSHFRNIFHNALSDTNSKVRAAALVALGSSGEKDIIAICRKMFETDESYLVMAEALKLIGKYGDRSQLKFLNEARKMKSARNVVSRAASEAIDMINNRK